MSEQQQFQPGDRVRVTMDLTVAHHESDETNFVTRGTVYPWTVEHWVEETHIAVELIERPEPPREPGLHLCAYEGRPLALRWDGGNWRWPGQGDGYVLCQNEVAVIGSITLNEGVEL